MTYGLLSGALRPVEQVCVLRSLNRQRGMLLRSQGRHVQRMQKALIQMKLQLTNVLSDVVGERKAARRSCAASSPESETARYWAR